MKHKSTILIVDDQLSAREVLRGLLTGQDYYLAFASNGREALAKAAELRPDLILLDVMMPDMDGFEVCRRLRAHRPLAEVPVIMVTALDDHDSLVQGIEAGADDFISKPFDQVELQARVRTITQLNRYRQLHAERTKFEWVVEHAVDGYLVVDDSDNILYANPQARLYLGLPVEENEPISATFLETTAKQYHYEPEQAWLTWPEQPAIIAQSPRYLVRSEESSTADTLWLQVYTLALPMGPDAGWVVHLRNVTEQVALQGNMWEFEAMVSHKLRTPLASMVTGLELLKEHVIELLSPEMSKFFGLVRRNAQRLSNDVEAILQYVQTPTLLQSGPGFKFSQLETTITQISADLELNSVTVSIQPELNVDRVSLSERAMALILREIFENAEKFHPHHTPTLEISVTCANDDKQVNIKIGDDGLTLSPERLAQVWAPYYQGDRPFTGEIIGMGLGLSKVALLVWGVGGTYRLYNRPDGPGVVVELTLPLARSAGEADK